MAKEIDIYISKYSENISKILKKIRSTIRSAAPNSLEIISYGIPTFDINGKHIIHFAGFKNHISIFPTPSATEKFQKELKDYKTSKGTIQFSLDKPIPYDLIKKITIYRVNTILSGSK